MPNILLTFIGAENAFSSEIDCLKSFNVYRDPRNIFKKKEQLMIPGILCQPYNSPVDTFTKKNVRNNDIKIFISLPLPYIKT